VIAGQLARLTPNAWLRAPRPTGRLRLTLLYGTLFLLSGTVLLAVTYVLAAHTTAITLPGPKGTGLSYLTQRPTVTPRTLTGAPNYTVHLTPAQMAQQQIQVTHLHDLAMHRLLAWSGLTLAVTVIISLGLGWLVAGRVLQPVRTISAAARRIGANNLNERLRGDGPDDEFRDLAATLDDLLERLQASFDTQRRFVANASHELRTPLTLDRALLERALRTTDPTHALWRSTCERLLASNEEQARLVDALLVLARSDGALDRPELLDLQVVIDKVLATLQADAASHGIQIHTSMSPTLVSGDSLLLERVVRNLIDNAIRHNISGGQVDVSTELRSGRTVLIVTNTGPIVPASDTDRLLQPFQRAGTDRTNQRDGLGLGLSIVQAIASAHHATLLLDPQPAGGLRIEVTFPAISAHDEELTNQAVQSPSATSTVLAARPTLVPERANEPQPQQEEVS